MTNDGPGIIGSRMECPQRMYAIASQTALGRVALANDIGGAVAALLAEGNRWINAQRIEVSGGVAICPTISVPLF